jgi:hypothetical protein
MLCPGWKDDRRGLRPSLLFKTTPGGKGAGTVGFKVRAWDPGVRFRVKPSAPSPYKTIPGGKGAGTG